MGKNKRMETSIVIMSVDKKSKNKKNLLDRYKMIKTANGAEFHRRKHDSL